MGFADMIDAQRHSGNRDFGTEESGRDVEAVKSKDTQEMARVLMGAEIAIARLDHLAASNPGMNISSRVAQFEKIEGQARLIMSQLSGGGAVDLAAIAAAMGSIESDFKVDSDDTTQKDDKADDKTKVDGARVEARIAMDEALYASPPPILLELIQRDETLGGIRAKNTELAQRARTETNDGSADLLAAVTIAGVLYEGIANKDKIEELALAAQAKAENYKNGLMSKGVSETDAEARLGVVVEQALKIHGGMQESQQAGAQKIIEAMEALVIAPLNAHMTESAGHFETAAAHVAKHSSTHSRQVNEQTEAWTILQEGTVQELQKHLSAANAKAGGLNVAGDSGDKVYADVMEQLGVGRMLETAVRYSDASAKLMESQGTVLHSVHHENKRARHMVMAVLRGDSDNYIAAAQAAGHGSHEGIKEMLRETGAAREHLGIAENTPSHLAAGSKHLSHGHTAHA